MRKTNKTMNLHRIWISRTLSDPTNALTFPMTRQFSRTPNGIFIDFFSRFNSSPTCVRSFSPHPPFISSFCPAFPLFPTRIFPEHFRENFWFIISSEANCRIYLTSALSGVLFFFGKIYRMANCGSTIAAVRHYSALQCAGCLFCRFGRFSPEKSCHIILRLISVIFVSR